MRAVKKAAIFVVSCGLLLVGMCWALDRSMWDKVRRTEAALGSQAVAQAAGRDLAQLCLKRRERPEWFDDDAIGPPLWLLPSLRELEPTWVQVSPDEIKVEFGGGFYHYGYLLQCDPTAPAQESTTWILWLYSETAESRELGRFTLTPADALSDEQFVDRVMVELDRRVTEAFDARGGRVHYESASLERCQVAVVLGEIARLRTAIRSTAQRDPQAWREALLVYVMDHTTDPQSAAARLRAWAESHGDFSAWLMAAYAFERVGEHEAAEEAVRQACRFPADDPRWVRLHARARGYALCQRLNDTARYETGAELCEHLLAYRGAGDHLADELRALRDACRAGRPAGALSASQRDDEWFPDDFGPFAGIDVAALRGEELR